jgi:adenylate cyclase
MGPLSAAELEALGVYDPAAPDARARLELLEYLVSLGATAEDLLEYRDQLPGLASVVTIRGGRALTLAEAVEGSGVPEEKVRRISRAAGFPEAGPNDRVFGEQFAQLAAGLAGAEDVFGEEAVLQLIRVMGAAMNRLADAMVSSFLINVDPGISEQDPAGLEVARANAQATELLPAVNFALDLLLRQHLLSARRSSLGASAEAGYETRHMCVGFVDLVGSTALAQRMSAGELGAALTEFEHIASDLVAAGGGRLVKLIGDEVLYVAADEASACAIALQFAARFAEHPTLPPVRAGVASGEVMMRDGDVFGPVVNLAARAVKVAAAGEVVVLPEVAAASNLDSEPLGRHRLKGFDDEVELSRILAG